MEDDFRGFLSQHLKLWWNRRGLLFSGSIAELPFQYYFTNFTDIDQMQFDLKSCAVSPTDPQLLRSPLSPDRYEHIYIIQDIPELPGYVRLLDGDCYLEKKNVLEKECQSYGAAERTDLLPGNNVNRGSNEARSAAKYLHQTLGYFKNIMQEVPVDTVPSVFSPYWPLQARAWRERKRTHGWPSQELIEHVAKAGCHFVSKPHPRFAHDRTMFRFSFSKSEVILIHSWTWVQKYIYHILRLAKKHTVTECEKLGYETPLCSYFFKTLMLWSCENKPREFWLEANIESSVRELLGEMITWLIDLKCPNYFIPKNNMFSHVMENGVNLDKEINLLLDCIGNVARTIETVPKALPKTAVILPTLDRVLVLLQFLFSRIYDCSNALTEVCPAISSKTCSSLMCKELKNLYRGIVEHFRLVTRKDKKHLHSALRYFTEAFLDKGGVTLKLVPLGEALIDHFVDGLFEENTSIPYCSDESKIDDRGTWTIDSNSFFAEILRCVQVCATDRIPKSSYFASAAYLANFHYMVRRDFREALRICECAIVVMSDTRETISEGNYFKSTCHVILSSKLMVMFDEPIQAVFGFAVLFADQVGVNSKMSEIDKGITGNLGRFHPRTMTIGDRPLPIVCRVFSVEFIEYLKYRCSLQLFRMHGEINKHCYKTQCQPEFHLNRISWFLFTALKID